MRCLIVLLVFNTKLRLSRLVATSFLIVEREDHVSLVSDSLADAVLAGHCCHALLP